ncbi:MAG: phytase [Oleispira sp.]
MNTLFKKTRFKNSLSLTLLSSVLSTLLTGCGLLSEHNSVVSVQVINSELAENINQFDQTDEMIDQFSDKVGYPLEGLCFYQPQGKMSPQQVFLLDESSMAHQMLIQQHKGDFSLQEIRRFPLPPSAEYCVVDDASDQLFVSEENVGVWVYSARAESEVSRAIIDLVKPYGNLNHNSGPLAIINQQLFVAEKESHYIHQYSVDKHKTSPSKAILHGSYQLGTNVKLDGLNVKQEGAHFILNYLDDSTEKAFKAEVLVGNNIMNNSPESGSYIVNIPADGETQPVSDAGDAADDPAIWVHPTVAEKSLVFGTNKKRGLLVYNLEGELLQQMDVGRVNNVDIRQGFTHKGQPADIAAASQRDNRSIALFHISPINGEVSPMNEIITGLDKVYGLCMYRGLERKVYVFINDQDGRYEQYEISDSAAGWTGKRVREFSVGSQPEGCAADDKNQRLFVGEENVALWTLGAEPDADNNSDSKLEKISAITDYLQVDIEGMDLYQTEHENYLLVSSQGNDSYVLFQAEAPYEYAGRFRIGLNAANGIDGASETDGLAVSSAYLGEKYPQGLVVVQDGRNLFPHQAQNFKLLSWQKIDQEILQ